MPNLAKLDCIARVNRAIDYIHQNLAGPLGLEEVARAACFSPYHFHRVFRGVVGETLHVFIKRVRLERALYLREHREGRSLTDIALACGFSSSSDFSRSFRKEFGVPPRAFDLEGFRRTRRGALSLERLAVGKNPDGFRVVFREYAPRHVAYVRVAGPSLANVARAAERLVKWADERDLGGGQWLGYMWEDPDIVPPERCRYDVGVEVPARLATDGDVGMMRFGAMKVAEVRIAGPIELELRAFDWLYSTWLPKSGFAPDHHPAFEAWQGKPFAHGDSHFALSVQLPVIDASLPLPVPST